MTRFIATFGFVGLIPVAPGTFGSLAAIPVAWLLHWLGGFPLLLSATFLVFFAGLHATRVETMGTVDHDPSSIVIDEVVGQWIALFPLSAGLWFGGAASHVFPWPGWVGAFYPVPDLRYLEAVARGSRRPYAWTGGSNA